MIISKEHHTSDKSFGGCGALFLKKKVMKSVKTVERYGVIS